MNTFPPYTQKVFPFLGRFGLAIFGSTFVNSRSMYSHVIDLASKLIRDRSENLDFQTIGQEIASYFQNQLKLQFDAANMQMALQPDNWTPFGFHFVGHSKDLNGEPSATTTLISIGRTARFETYEGIGCSVSGDSSIVNKIWQGGPETSFIFFSLQDAIDYAKFLIRTTADYQRFSGNLPTVGGEIDIALVTSYRGFQWISQKPLYKMLEKDDSEKWHTDTSKELK